MAWVQRWGIHGLLDVADLDALAVVNRVATVGDINAGLERIFARAASFLGTRSEQVVGRAVLLNHDDDVAERSRLNLSGGETCHRYNG
jgi:hypothetical protein